MASLWGDDALGSNGSVPRAYFLDAAGCLLAELAAAPCECALRGRCGRPCRYQTSDFIHRERRQRATPDPMIPIPRIASVPGSETAVGSTLQVVQAPRIPHTVVATATPQPRQHSRRPACRP